MNRIYLIVLFLMYAGLVNSQDLIKAKGSAQIRLEDNLSLDEAREEVKRLAMINAIENQFGMYVEQDSDVDIENGKASFKIIGHTLVKGDWIKTTSEKYKEEARKIRGRGKNKEVWISCKIEGWIREIKNPETALDFTPLNCLDPACRTYDFKQGEPLYLSFQTKSEGFLSVFVLQDDGMAYRILPYQSMPENYMNAVPVKAGLKYTFFSNREKHDYFEGFPYMLTDELLMVTDKQKEYLDFYIVFSKREYDSPFLYKNRMAENLLVPESVPGQKFNEWLTENRMYDPEFLYKRITLTVFK